MDEVNVGIHLNVSWTCPKCKNRTSHAILGDKKPKTVRCVNCGIEYKSK